MLVVEVGLGPLVLMVLVLAVVCPASVFFDGDPDSGDGGGRALKSDVCDGAAIVSFW